MSGASRPTWHRRHLLQLEGLSAAELTALLDEAESLRDVAAGRAPRLNDLAGRTVANLFFEDSTRTRCSFTLAARRLGADTIDLTSAGSSVSKGETMIDTALNLLAMGVDAFVVRCSASGGPHMIARALDDCAKQPTADSRQPIAVPVINAGDGRHEHPTQGLLDILTLRQRFDDLRGRTVGIVGDIANSRVARSAVHGLTTLGANVILCGPPTLAPKSFEKIVNAPVAPLSERSPPKHCSESSATYTPGRVQVMHDLDAILPKLDAIMMLRVQFERTGGGAVASLSVAPLSERSAHGVRPHHISGDYRELYGLTTARAAKLPEHAIVMHPGPINRGLELDSDVADDSAISDQRSAVSGSAKSKRSAPSTQHPVRTPSQGRSVILQQVANGVAVRMAVLRMLMTASS